jgi:hypothetical protein
MKLHVISYNADHDYHVCKNDDGHRVNVDLLVDGSLPEGTAPLDLIGKTVEVEYTHAYVSIANGVRLIGEKS